MDIDKLAPVIGIVVWILFGTLFKGKKQKPAPSAPRKSGGGFGDLSKTLRKVFEEMQGPVQTFSEDSFPPEDRSEEVAEEQPVTSSVTEPAGRASTADKPAPELPPVANTDAGRTRIGKAILRQGIVLSEILSPPVTLRE
jgi:hypothetical protein